MPIAPEESGELVVEKLVPDGRALARLPDGRVVLLSGCVPGDHIVLETAMARGGWVEGKAFRLIAPSPLRIEPRCPVAQECGGCDYMVMEADEQQRQKMAVLAEALARTGKLRDVPLPVRLEGGARDGYRSRVRLQVSGQRIGFHARGSHELVEPARCQVSSDAINDALTELRRLARAEPQALSAFVWLEVREATDTTVSIYLQRGEQPLPAGSRRWLAALRQRYIVVTDAALAGQQDHWQRFQLTPEVYMLSPPGTFTQVNWEVNRALVARVVAGARERGAHSFFDAFSGAGNFSLPLLCAGLRGVAVESNRLAVAAAQEAARRQELSAETFRIGDAGALARELARAGARFDLVLVDPPRAGVKHGLSELASLATGSLVMCSCNPVTLARDLRVLVDLGFCIESIEGFDMFPETHHLETLVFLRAPGASTHLRRASGLSVGVGGGPPEDAGAGGARALLQAFRARPSSATTRATCGS